MPRRSSPPRGKYQKLALLLRQSRALTLTVEQVAQLLKVKKSLVYQLEQGNRKPAVFSKPKRNGVAIERLAEVYGIPLNSPELWEALIEVQLPLYLQILGERIQVQREAAGLVTPSEQLSADDRAQVQRFSDFLIWQKQQSKT